MEGAGEEPLPLFSAVLQRTVGCTRWYAHMVRNIFYAVSVSTVVGRVDVVWLVVATHVAHQANFPHY